MASSFPRSPVFSSSKCSGAATRAAQKLPVAPAPSGSSKKMESSFDLNYLQNHLLQVPALRLQFAGATLPRTPKRRT